MTIRSVAQRSFYNDFLENLRAKGAAGKFHNDVNKRRRAKRFASKSRHRNNV